jgi:hypothetical protein
MKSTNKFALLTLFLFSIESLKAATREVATSDTMVSFHLQGDSCSINFIDDPRYIFIEGSIGNVKGKFMFDTGIGTGLTINSLYVKMPGGRKIGKGFNGSGEHYDIYRLDTVRNIKIGENLVFPACGPAQTNEEKGIQEDLMPDFLGLIGYDSFKGYIFKLDYQHHRLTFYKNTDIRNNNKDYLEGEKVIAVLDVRTSILPNHPLIDVHIDSLFIEAGFDTGTPGAFYPSDSLKQELINKGLLSAEDDHGEAVLKNLVFTGGFNGYTRQLHVLPPDAANGIKKAIGFKQENIIELGHGFLSQYKTVWDYDHHKIYLLQK